MTDWIKPESREFNEGFRRSLAPSAKNGAAAAGIDEQGREGGGGGVIRGKRVGLS